MSIMLTAGAMVFASVLPGNEAGDYNSKIINNNKKLQRVEEAMRTFMVTNGRRPCPADGSSVPGQATFGLEAANPGTCTGSTPAAPMGPDTSTTDCGGTGCIVSGTIPTRSLHLDDSYTFDDFGRRFTYVVDRRATNLANCRQLEGITLMHPTPTGKGGVVIHDNSGAKTDQVMYAYISHGPSGYGAFPEQGAATPAKRINTGSTNASKQTNAGVDVGNNPGASTFTYDTTIFTNVKIRNDRVFASGNDTGFDDVLFYREDIKNICCLGSLCIPKGFVINGVTNGDLTGGSTQGYWGNSNNGTAFGDVNGDGIADLIISAPIAYAGSTYAGKVFVVFGTRNAFPAPLPLSSLDGTNGFMLYGSGYTGIGWDVAGYAVATGDVNHDGVSDIIIGSLSGKIRVVFGGATRKDGTAWTSCSASSGCLLTTAFLNGTNGFELTPSSYSTSFYSTGNIISLAAADVNGDGITDIVAGTNAFVGANNIAISGAADNGSGFVRLTVTSTAGIANNDRVVV